MGVLIFQGVVLLFFQLNYNKLYPTRVTKIAEIAYAIYQGLFNFLGEDRERNMLEEKVTTFQGLVGTKISSWPVLTPSSPD